MLEIDVSARLRAEKLAARERERETKESLAKTTYMKGGDASPGAFDMASKLKAEKLEAKKREQDANEKWKEKNRSAVLLPAEFDMATKLRAEKLEAKKRE